MAQANGHPHRWPPQLCGGLSLAEIDRDLLRLRERLETVIEAAIALLDRLDAPAEDLEDGGIGSPGLRLLRGTSGNYLGAGAATTIGRPANSNPYGGVELAPCVTGHADARMAAASPTWQETMSRSMGGDVMRRKLMTFGFATGTLLFGLGLSGAEASVNKPIPPESLGTGSAVTPAAMCGFRCRYGGFYIPGPPWVCFQRGLNYCGPS